MMHSFLRGGVVVAAVILGLAALPAQAQSDAPAAVHTFGGVVLAPSGTALLSIESSDAADTEKRPPALTLRDLHGGAPRVVPCPITACTFSGPVWSPDSSRFAAVVRATSGDRARSIWTFAADGSDPRVRLASFGGTLNALRWLGDNKTLALLVTPDARKEIGATSPGAAQTGEISAALVHDVQRIATLGDDGMLHYASPPDLFVYEFDAAVDGKTFVATAAHGNGDNNWWIAKLYAFEGGTSVREVLAPAMQMNAPRLSPDGKSIAFIGGLMSDFGSVGGDAYVVPLAGGTPVDVTPNAPVSINALVWASPTTLRVTALANDRAMLGTIDIAARTIRTDWSAPVSISGDARLRMSFAQDGTAAFVQQSFVAPPEIYAGSAPHFAQLTHENSALAPRAVARSVGWTNDGFAVQGWLITPLHPKPGVMPLITVVHGGPSAATTPSYITRGSTADFLGRGWAVFFPNPRGSYGEGEAFTRANVRDFGGGDLRDILAGVDAVERVAPIDEHRLGITGGSYGGFMTLWTITQTNRFRAAVAGAGIANWQSYYGQNGIDEWMIPFFGASVYDDPAIYAKLSPIQYIKAVKTPVFLYVGERDVECPPAQSLEYWHALDTLGKPASLVIYEGEGHGIRGTEHRRDITQRTMNWFDTYFAK